VDVFATRFFSIKSIRDEYPSQSPPRASFVVMTARNVEANQSEVCARNIMPDPTAEVGHCVHRIAMHPSKPRRFSCKKHWDVMRSDDAGIRARSEREFAERFRISN